MYKRSSVSDTVPTVFPRLKIPLVEESPIYEIVPGKEFSTYANLDIFPPSMASLLCNFSGSVGVRQRNYCYFFLYDDSTEDITFKKCLKVKKQDHPFVSIDSCGSEFCTVDSNRHVKFWTPHTTK